MVIFWKSFSSAQNCGDNCALYCIQYFEIGTKKWYTINLDYQEKPKNEKTINVKYVDISNSSDIDDSE